MSLLERYVRAIIERVEVKDSPEPTKGGTHTFHGNNWPASKIGVPGPRFDDDAPVSEEDLDDAEEWLKEFEPDRIIAYSRGAAVLHRLASERDIEIPEVTYVAPAAKRDAWGTKGISAPKVSGRAIASSGDSNVSVKQVCKIADEAGVSMYIVPGKFKSGDRGREGLKNHIRVLRHKDDKNPGKQIDVAACLASDLPDWASGVASDEDLEKQIEISKELTREWKSSFK
jgi:hypothetical protein